MAIGNLVAFADPVRAGTNIAAWNLINQVNSLNREIAIRQLRIATGKQQPRMEDGASFFAIWNKMKNQVRGKAMAIDNIGDAKDELSLAEAGLLQVDDFLGKMRDLIVRASSDTLTPEQREDVKQELVNLYMAITDVVARTKFNEGGKGEQALLGGFSHTYQVGPNESEMDKFTVDIPNVLLAVTKALAPEVGTKLEAFFQVLDSMPESTRGNLGDEIQAFTGTLPEGGVKNAMNDLAKAVKSNNLPAEFLSSMMMLSSADRAEFDQQLSNLYETRIKPAVGNDATFQNDAAITQQFQNFAPLIEELIGNPNALDAMVAGFQDIANSHAVDNPDFINALTAVRDAIAGVSEPFKVTASDLEALVSEKFGTPLQQLTLGQDLVFFASIPAIANRPKVQEALNQLALDVANGVDGFPNFVDAIGGLDGNDRALLKAALSQIATDPQNGLSFHVAQPNLDGQGGPLFVDDLTFAGELIKLGDAQTANNVASVLQGVANDVASDFPGVADSLNQVIGLVQQLGQLGLPFPQQNQDDRNLATLFSAAAQQLSSNFPQVADTLNQIAGLMSDADDSNDNALGEAFRRLGSQIENATGGFFFDPAQRQQIQQVFVDVANSQAFANLTDPVKNAYISMVNDLTNATDLNGFFRGPFSPNSNNSFAAVALAIDESASAAPPPTDASTAVRAQLANTLSGLAAQLEQASGGADVDGAVRAALRQVLLNQTGSQAFAALPTTLQATYLALAESLGAYTADQIGEIDAKLDAFANTLDPNTDALVGAFDNLITQLSGNAVNGDERQALTNGLAAIAQAIGNVDGNDAKLQAFRNLIDDPNSQNDLVGALSHHISTGQAAAFEKALTTLTDGEGLGGAFDNFLMINDSGDGAALISGVDDAVNAVKDTLINLGGVQTKLTSLEDILSTSITAEDSVASRFGDADLAKEQVELTKLQLFSQLANAQAAAANVFPGQIIAGLLGGGR